MLRMTWRNLFARKVRLGLSAFAVVLGVAFVAGSFIFTDAMGDAFDGIIEGSTADVEIAYRGANDFDSQQDLRVIGAPVVERALASLASADDEVAPAIDWEVAGRRVAEVDIAALQAPDWMKRAIARRAGLADRAATPNDESDRRQGT